MRLSGQDATSFREEYCRLQSATFPHLSAVTCWGIWRTAARISRPSQFCASAVNYSAEPLSA